MRNVIQKVLAAEAEAKNLLDAGRVEADRIREAAQKKGQALLALSRQETRGEVETILETATRQAELEKQERLAKAAVEIETQFRLDDAIRQRAVEAVVRCVCSFGPPAEK